MTDKGIKPLDHAEIAVRAVEMKLESVIGELRGLMQAADIAGCEAFDRAAAAMDHTAEFQGAKFSIARSEAKAHKASLDGLKSVALAARAALTDVQAARGRYREIRERGELEQLLVLFEAEDRK